MMALQRLWGQVTLFALAIIGAGIALYLTSVHYAHVDLVCSAQGFVDCQRVISSPYSVIPGTTLPVTLPGLVWSLIAAVLAFVGWQRPDLHNVRVVQCIWAGLAMLAVLYLVYIELVLLHTLCAWCTGFHVVIFAMFLLSVAQLQQPERDVFAEDNNVEQAQSQMSQSKASKS